MRRSATAGASEYDSSGRVDELAGHFVSDGTCYLDRSEVMAGRSREFVEAFAGAPTHGGGANKNVAGSGQE